MARKSSSATSRKRATGLTPERILRSALRIADEDGLTAVSMRSIAAKLGVEAMSLYNHVTGKEQIIVGIIDLVLEEIDVLLTATDWKASMRRRAISAREAMLRHPWAAALIESHSSTSDVRLRYADSVLSVLRRAGFTIQQAYGAFLTLDSYIYGFVLQEVNWPHEPQEVPEAIEQIRPQVSPSRFPYVTEVMSFVARQRSESPGGYESEFAFGLELVLDGLERLLSASGEGSLDTFTP